MPASDLVSAKCTPPVGHEVSTAAAAAAAVGNTPSRAGGGRQVVKIRAS